MTNPLFPVLIWMAAVTLNCRVLKNIFLLLSSIRPGQPYKHRSGILSFPGSGVMGPGLHSPGVLMLLQIVAPLLVLGSPDTWRGYREWGESRWDGLRGGLSPGVSAISTCTGEPTMAAVGRKGELDATYLEGGHWESNTGCIQVLKVFKGPSWNEKNNEKVYVLAGASVCICTHICKEGYVLVRTILYALCLWPRLLIASQNPFSLPSSGSSPKDTHPRLSLHHPTSLLWLENHNDWRSWRGRQSCFSSPVLPVYLSTAVWETNFCLVGSTPFMSPCHSIWAYTYISKFIQCLSYFLSVKTFL